MEVQLWHTELLMIVYSAALVQMLAPLVLFPKAMTSTLSTQTNVSNAVLARANAPTMLSLRSNL